METIEGRKVYEENLEREPLEKIKSKPVDEVKSDNTDKTLIIEEG